MPVRGSDYYANSPMDEMKRAKHSKDLAVVRAIEGRPSSHSRSGYRGRTSISSFIRSYCDGIRWLVLGYCRSRYSGTSFDRKVGERAEATPMIGRRHISKWHIGHGLLGLAHLITIILIIALFVFVWSNL